MHANHFKKGNAHYIERHSKALLNNSTCRCLSEQYGHCLQRINMRIGVRIKTKNSIAEKVNIQLG